MTDTRTVFTPQDADNLAAYLSGLSLPFTVTVKDGKARSISQNSLLHKWFGEVSEHSGDMTASEVKGQCHHKYGLAIKLQDPQWAWVWERSAGGLSYEKRCKALASGVFNVSSGMTVPELRGYMDEMQRECLRRGVRLTIPEDRK